MDTSLLTLFPTAESNWANENVRTEGALLRDYFAAKIMAALIASEQDYTYCFVNAEDFASKSYVMADALLKARGETNA